MEAFDNICRMAVDHADLADFIVVYIEEAHPTDGWAVPDNVPISQHRSLEERLTAAALLTTSSRPANMTVVADTMSNELNIAYGAAPDRLYIIHNGTIAYEGEPGPFRFQPEPVASWLQTYRNSLQSN